MYKLNLQIKDEQCRISRAIMCLHLCDGGSESKRARTVFSQFFNLQSRFIYFCFLSPCAPELVSIKFTKGDTKQSQVAILNNRSKIKTAVNICSDTALVKWWIFITMTTAVLHWCLASVSSLHIVQPADNSICHICQVGTNTTLIER